MNSGSAGPDMREFDRAALHSRVGKQHGAKRPGSKVREASQPAAHRGGGNDGARINPGVVATQQVHLANERMLAMPHAKRPCFVQPR